MSNHGRTKPIRSSSYIFSQPGIHYHRHIPDQGSKSGLRCPASQPALPSLARAAGARVGRAEAQRRSRSRQRSMVQTKARALKRAAEAAAKPPSKKKAKSVSEPLVKKKRKGKQARDRAKEAAKVSAAYLAAKAAGKGAAAPSEPTPTLRMRGLPFSATTDDISGMRPSDRTPD